MAVLTGLDNLIGQHFTPILGKRIGVVCNQATIAHDYRHILEHLTPLHRAEKLFIASVMGPQHGLWGHTQDNMVEWEGEERELWPVYSLYGEHRKPTPSMLENVELLLIDLPDIGSRYYTFIWTTALCMEAAAEHGIPVMILDRPNPIGGTQVEGTVLKQEFSSFVGLYPLPTRHGMTLGEIGTYLAQTYFVGCDLAVMRALQWGRSQYFEEAGLPWAMPSPNMPAVETAVVYPGGCLIEGTNLSEGRGTTRPFEIVGAPYLDSWEFASRLNSSGLSGVYFRPIQFQPTFQKHANTICDGVFVHVTDRSIFKPFFSYVAILQEACRLADGRFEWKSPPYEYEFNKLPFDILAGNDWLRTAIEYGTRLEQIEERTRTEIVEFEPIRQASLLYNQPT